LLAPALTPLTAPPSLARLLRISASASVPACLLLLLLLLPVSRLLR